MNRINTKIKSIERDSIAEEVGIEPCDFLISINDSPISDILEYKFLINDDFINVVIRKPNGEEWEIEIEKEDYEDLGIEFEDPLLCDAKSCKNKCIFCFIDQNPKGMRETIYFKDDDSRLSFLQGNYITLTNLKECDIDRIIKYRISPLNISVHTTNPKLRVKMLNNKDAGNVYDILKTLVCGGITINTQIVLCYDINDKAELDRSLTDLSKLFPNLCSISVVPAGITRHREGLFKLSPFDKEKSMEVIKQVEYWQKNFKKLHGTNLVYLADEFYVMADKETPAYREYEDFPQIENGVGLIAQFQKEFYDYLKVLKKKPIKSINRSVSIATGSCAYKHMKGLCEELEKLYNNLTINLYEIKNDFFGHNVTVTGLLTAEDIINQLTGKDLGEELVLTECMLRQGEDVFLDDLRVCDVERELEIKVRISPVNGEEFVKTTLGSL